MKVDEEFYLKYIADLENEVKHSDRFGLIMSLATLVTVAAWMASLAYVMGKM